MVSIFDSPGPEYSDWLIINSLRPMLVDLSLCAQLHQQHEFIDLAMIDLPLPQNSFQKENCPNSPFYSQISVSYPSNSLSEKVFT